MPKFQEHKILTWLSSFCTSWVKTSFDFLSLSITVLENPARGGLGLLEYGEAGLELTPGCGIVACCGGGDTTEVGGIIIGHQPLFNPLNVLGNATSFSCVCDGTWEARTIEESVLAPGFPDLISRYLTASVEGENRTLEDLISSPLSILSRPSIERRGAVAFLLILDALPTSAALSFA